LTRAVPVTGAAGPVAAVVAAAELVADTMNLR